MKRTIIYLIAILVLLTACSTTKDDDSGILENADETGTSSSSVALDKQVTKSHENETSLESSTRIVEIEPEQAIFDDTDEFLTAIIDDDGNTIHNNYRLNNIDMYFVPVVIPDNYHLEYISVDDKIGRAHV